MVTNKQQSPLPLFDALEHINATAKLVGSLNLKYNDDYTYALDFLKSYTGSKGTFNAYRREIEKLLHWSWNIRDKSIKDLRRDDIEEFMYFIQSPPLPWIGTKKAPRFIIKDAMRQPNSEWRPFVVVVSKAEHKKGKRPDINNFELSQNSLKEAFAILSSFYNYLLQEEFASVNPVSLIRQKSKFLRKQQSKSKIRRLSALQWQYVIDTVSIMADENPDLHERTLFIMIALYSMYLRISELAASERWTPTMNDFERDDESNWWFTTVGKGNKERQIAVSDSMLQALKRYREYLGLYPLPSPADKSFLLPKTRGKGAITSTTYLRDIVQQCFDNAINRLKTDEHHDDAELLTEATVHWLRHTGISDDVKHRPREHVRDDAGHSSSSTTDKYIDIELKERHASAKEKQI